MCETIANGLYVGLLTPDNRMKKQTKGDFSPVDVDTGRKTPPGYPPGIKSKTLADSLDEGARTGHRTLLMRYRPGAQDDRVLTYETVDEV